LTWYTEHSAVAPQISMAASALPAPSPARASAAAASATWQHAPATAAGIESTLDAGPPVNLKLAQALEVVPAER
jgi:hypothetical protein